MSTKIKFTLRINGLLSYDCTSYTPATNIFSATIVSSSVEQVRNDMDYISLIEILDKEGLVIHSTSSFNKLSSLNLRIGFGYNEESKTTFDLIQLGFSCNNLEEKVATLESIINPIVNESTMSLDDYKAYRIAESKTLLAQYLKDHPITSTAHGGTEGVYSVTKETQDLLNSNYVAYTIASKKNNKATLTWNEAGKSCEMWTVDEYEQLILEIKDYVTPFVAYQQNIEEQINELNTKTSIKALVFDYSSAN